MRIHTLACLIALTWACAGKDLDSNRPPKVAGVCAGTYRNPLDAALCDDLETHQPLLAKEREVCSRLAIDLFGMRPTEKELASCAVNDIESVIHTMQKDPRYRLHQRRMFADRLGYFDLTAGYAAIRVLDEMVDRLYTGELGYRDFAIEAITHPGYVGSHRFGGEFLADFTVRTFLGRRASEPERRDLLTLWNNWITVYDGADYMIFGALAVDPYACSEGRSCTSNIFGEVSIEFPRNGRETAIAPGALTPEDWEALRGVGRHFAKLPMFWEAPVDEVTRRYLGYDLGALRPAARQVLVDAFRASNGDVLALEHMVLSSRAYRLTTKGSFASNTHADDTPIAAGPSKWMIPEAWLHSLGVLIGTELGDCDFRYSILDDFFGFALGPIPDDHRYPRTADGEIDPWFLAAAGSLGGCPGRSDARTFFLGRAERTTEVGLVAAVSQEEIAEEVCFDFPVPALVPALVDANARDDLSIEQTIVHVLSRAYGSAPSTEVVEIQALIAAECADCAVIDIARGLCVAIATSVEFQQY